MFCLLKDKKLIYTLILYPYQILAFPEDAYV